MAFSAKIVGDELVLRIPMNATPEKSSSGKTLLVASTYGNKETDCVVDGKKVIVGVNAYISKKWVAGDVIAADRPGILLPRPASPCRVCPYVAFYVTFLRKPDIFRENRHPEPSYSGS